MSKECARYEPVAWWFTRSRIGRGLREQYEIPTELSSNLLAVIRQLDTIEGNQLFREIQRGHHGETADSAISTHDLVFASERSIAELDAPAPPITGDDDPSRRREAVNAGPDMVREEARRTLVIPENSIRTDSRPEAESAHHSM
jgi:hypothetical protein